MRKKVTRYSVSLTYSEWVLVSSCLSAGLDEPFTSFQRDALKRIQDLIISKLPEVSNKCPRCGSVTRLSYKDPRIERICVTCNWPKPTGRKRDDVDSVP